MRVSLYEPGCEAGGSYRPDLTRFVANQGCFQVSTSLVRIMGPRVFLLRLFGILSIPDHFLHSLGNQNPSGVYFLPLSERNPNQSARFESNPGCFQRSTHLVRIMDPQVFLLHQLGITGFLLLLFRIILNITVSSYSWSCMFLY